MQKFLVLKQNKEIEIVEAREVKDLFDDKIIYGRLKLDTMVGELSFWYDDEGLFVKGNQVNYNASLLGNYNAFVGDIILDKDCVEDGEIESKGFTDEEINNILSSIKFLNEKYGNIDIKKPEPGFEIIDF